MSRPIHYLPLLALCLVAVACGPASTPAPNVMPTSPAYPAGTTNLPTQSSSQSGYPAATSSAPTPVLPQGYPGSATATITYQDFEIVPATLSVPAGSTIQFIIQSASGVAHRPMSQTEPNIFQAPDQLGNGATYTQVFAQSGTVVLLCAYHPDMKATLTVTP